MGNLELLRALILELMIERLGELSEADLALIKVEARDSGLDNRQLDRLLQEVYSSINWSKIRDEREGEDRVTAEPVYIFDVQVKSLQKLGEVLFDHPERALKYLADAVFLKANVNYLSHQNIDLAMQYADLYQSENDQEKRYLKVCYRLNPKLPYRINGKFYRSVRELLAAGFEDLALINKIYQDYSSGRLHIWLQAQDIGHLVLIPGEQKLRPFLFFVYQVDAHFPFYIDKELFDRPLDVVARAREDLDFWKKISAYCTNGSLFIWFGALGHPEWQVNYELALERIQSTDGLDETEKAYVLVQQLLYIIDADLLPPAITVSQDKIENLTLAAANNVSIPVWLNLAAPGFVKPVVRLEPEVNGLALDKSTVVLFDLTGQQQETITLSVDPQKLVKNKAYHAAIQIITPYETLIIPVSLKAVFPFRAFLLYLFKYSLFGALLFGVIRWLLAAGTGHAYGLAPQIITSSVGRSLPDNYLVFYWVFVAMLAGIAISVAAIRKVEKI